MNKLLIPSIVVAVVVAGGAFYFLNQQSAKPTTPTAPTVMEQTGETPKPAMMSLKELMAGGAQQCTYTAQVPDVGVTNGIVFVSDGKVRGDFKIIGTTPETTIEGSMIADGDYMYTWNSAMAQGMKIAISDEMKTETTDGAKTQYGGMDLGEKMDYDCKPWSVDATKFVPPADINFTVMNIPTPNSMMDKTSTGSSVTKPQEANPDLCSACNNLTGADKTACLSALNCQ